MAWDEWDQLKASAAERHSAQMQLNQLPADRGGSGGSGTPAGGQDLQHSAKPWNSAATTAHELGVSTGTSKTSLGKGHAGMAGGLEGLASLAELKTVLTSWENRLKSVADECDALEPKLRQVPKDLGGVDTATGAKADSVKTPKVGEDK
ncbi:amino acid ABC transporter permease [Streptomyces ficellus]|uniref:Amino acid ABC transporter permease n=1 Tax=Streptomyces ficellus TaxID=1977088 RepID=A0A6I6F603_9ACTN|nr:amino acid ABC transporter permease [Streptomyces ficellus]QGV78174.1 amino acid ABC transporter permease [Streptomyces ficellus]